MSARDLSERPLPEIRGDEPVSDPLPASGRVEVDLGEVVDAVYIGEWWPLETLGDPVTRPHNHLVLVLKRGDNVTNRPPK